MAEVSVDAAVLASPVLAGFAAWLADRPDFAARTRQTYAERASTFLAWVAESGGYADALDGPAGRDRAVSDYLASARSRGVTPSTINVSVAALTALYCFLGIGEPAVAWAPATRVTPRTLGAAEQRALLTAAAAVGPRAMAIVQLGLDVGPRESEMAGLDDTDADLTDHPGTIDVTDSDGRTRTVPMAPGTRAALVAWLAHRRQLLGRGSTERALFVSLRAPHRRIAARTVDDIVREVGADAGLVIAPGTLRATAELREYRAGTPLPAVATRFGQQVTDRGRMQALLGADGATARAAATGTEQLMLFGPDTRP
ncbi:tyrosine-type recombinase/integrase [Nocardia brasiliensis]|uniref:tyrosine-type recombinase/integrase n=1 Tax=Streptomyces sp. NPDC056056 TaxID=3345698 RepID=UPI0035D5F7A4